MSRHYFPGRLSSRWFATRGWALGAALTFGVTALFIKPPFIYETYGWLATSLFTMAALSMFGLSWSPESHRWRILSVLFTMLAASGRAWALILDSEAQPFQSRVIAATVWLFVGYACWLLAMFTAKIPNRGRR